MSAGAIVRVYRSAAISALASIALVEAAAAHHGFGSFDRSREIEITGTITGIDFVNPHTWVYAGRQSGPREGSEPEAERAAPSRPWWRFWD
jgi:hypothetical protein